MTLLLERQEKLEEKILALHQYISQYCVADHHYPMSVEETSKYIGIPVSTIYEMLERRELPGCKMGKRCNLKREVHGLRGDISANKTSIDSLAASVDDVKEAVKERETVTVYVPQTNVSQPWHERMVELSKMPVLKNPYFITLAVIILVQFGILFYTTSVVKEQRTEIASIRQDNSEIVKLYHRQSYIFERIEKMDETVSKLATEKSKKSSSGKKRR